MLGSVARLALQAFFRARESGLSVAAILAVAAVAAGQAPERAVQRLPRIVTPAEREALTAPHPDGLQVSTPLSPSSNAGKPESLEEAIATALALDPWLDAQRYQTDAARSQSRAANAEAYPWVDLGASYTLRDNEPSFVVSQPMWMPGVTTMPYSQQDSAGYFALVNVPIYTSGRIPSLIEAAESRVVASELELSIAQRNLKLSVAEEFVAVLRARSEVLLARSTADSLSAHLHDVEMFFRHDQRPRNDLLAAQVALADAKHAVIAAENQLDSACAAYNRRMARPLDTPVLLEDLALHGGQDDIHALQAVALAQREELAQLAARAQALKREAESIEARNRPQAAITGGYTFSENRFQSPEGITSLGIGVTWNAFDAGRDRHKACALQQQAAAIHRLRADQESRVRLEVRRAWLAVHETRKRLDVTRESLSQANENVRVAKQRYANGMGTNTEVLNAESLRIRSFRNHHHAYYDAVISEKRLERAVAGG